MKVVNNECSNDERKERGGRSGRIADGDVHLQSGRVDGRTGQLLTTCERMHQLDSHV